MTITTTTTKTFTAFGRTFTSHDDAVIYERAMSNALAYTELHHPKRTAKFRQRLADRIVSYLEWAVESADHQPEIDFGGEADGRQ